MSFVKFVSVFVVSGSLFCSTVCAKDFKIGVFQSKKLETEVKAIAEVKTKISDKQKELSKKVESEKLKMEKKISTLKSGKNAPTQKDQEKIGMEVREIEIYIQSEAKKIQDFQISLAEKIDEKIREESENIAKKNGYSMIVSDSVAVYHDSSFDVTDELVDSLNKKYQSFSL